MSDLNKSKRCCFTGHRPEKLNMSEKDAKTLLCYGIQDAIDKGYTTFITGMAPGVDIWAGEIVLEFKNIYPFIKLICALPYPTFYSNRSKAEQERYKSILSKCDLTHISSPVCNRLCYQSRNMWMVDNSNLVIAFFTGESGGTYNTVKYAKNQGVDIINLLN